MNRQYRACIAQRNAGVDDFLTATLHLRVAALHGCIVKLGIAVPARDRRGSTAAPRPICIDGPPSTTSGEPGAIARLST